MNKLFIGDNLSIMRSLPDESIDLIATDPPFMSQRNYGEFKDKWKSIEEFCGFMRLRLIEAHRLLKPIGSIYVHLDPTISHYIKIEMDRIFGINNFRNEIIWQRTFGHKPCKRNLPNNSDSILRYSKTNNYIWNLDHMYIKGDHSYISKFNKNDNDGKGSYYLNYFEMAKQHQKPERDLKPYTYEVLGLSGTYKWVKDRAIQGVKDNIVVRNNNNIYHKIYLNEQKGIQINNIWTDIHNVMKNSSEYTGYNTQKPLALYQRIIQLSSNKEDLVLDPFCGSGTTLNASQSLNRNWIGIDKNPNTVDYIKNRFDDRYGLLNPNYEVIYE